MVAGDKEKGDVNIHIVIYKFYVNKITLHRFRGKIGLQWQFKRWSKAVMIAFSLIGKEVF